MGSVTETYKISEKTQEVVDDYSNYVAGGFAPYPVPNPRNAIIHLESAYSHR